MTLRRFVVWGYANSWIVHEVNLGGKIIRDFGWVPTQDAANQIKTELEGLPS